MIKTYIILAAVLAFLVLYKYSKVEGLGAKWTASGLTLAPNHARFYKDANFTGRYRDFPVGTYQRSLSKGFLGINKENDTYSSIVVGAGLKVTVYEHNDFQGHWIRITGPYKLANLNPWKMNDRISSLKVERA